ncbi:hypothetical protein Q7P37_001549 [Cladosporium fusiforme]
MVLGCTSIIITDTFGNARQGVEPKVQGLGWMQHRLSPSLVADICEITQVDRTLFLKSPERTPRAHMKIKEKQKQTSLLSPRIELSAFALGTAALVYFARHTNLSLPGLIPHPRFKQSGRGGSFLQGFLLASATASVVGIASTLYLSKLMNLDVDFSKLPAHKASKHTVASTNFPAGAIAPSTYRKFALREKTELSEGVYRFVFDLPTSASVLGLPIGQHIGIRGSVEDTSVTRSYTPVSNNRDLGRLELLIRIYPDGHLGQYLKALQPGDKVDIRGPKSAMRYRKGMSKELGMIGGGTGITPLFQLIRAICEDKTDTTKINLVYANRSEADIMLRNRLDSFAEASNGQFSVHYMLDKPPAGWKYGTGHIDKDVLQQKMPAVSDENKVLVCGPPGLVNATKNNLTQLGWKEPGSHIHALQHHHNIHNPNLHIVVMTTQWSPPESWETRPICVLGGGVLGRRIAACFVAAGHNVRVRDPSEKSRHDAIDFIKENLSSFTTLLPRQPKQAETYEAFEDFSSAVKDCWMVFEAVPEILPLKESTFAELEKYAPKDAIFGSNSSSFKSGELLSKVKESTKARVLNTHFMMSPQRAYIPGDFFPFVEARHREAGLHPVTALRESSGFIFNRIWAAIKREVLAVLAERVSKPEVIDGIWKEQYNSLIGPYGVGLDTVEHIEQHYVDERGLPPNTLTWLQQNYIKSGKLGNKSPDKGGLYSPPAPGSRTQILFLNVGLGEPLGNKSLSEIMSSGEILSMTAEDRASKPVALVRNQALPDGIDVCEGRMFWTNMGNPSKNDGTVQSAKLDGSGVQTVVKAGDVHTPKQLHIDQSTKKLYFCDREGLRVLRCNLDGSERETLVQTGDWQYEPGKVADQHNWPVGITVSQRLGKLLWTQKGGSKASDGTIYAAPLQMPAGKTAANREDIEVVQDKLSECIDLEMDDETGVLYWTSRGELPLGNTLNKKQIIGKPPAGEKKLGHQIIAQGLGEGIGLKLDKGNDCLYVADMAGRLWKCDPKGGLKEKIYGGPTHAYTGLAFVKY